MYAELSRTINEYVWFLHVCRSLGGEAAAASVDSAAYNDLEIKKVSNRSEIYVIHVDGCYIFVWIPVDSRIVYVLHAVQARRLVGGFSEAELMLVEWRRGDFKRVQ